MRSLLVSALVVLAALLVPSAAQACSCVGFEDPEEQAEAILGYSDAAFIGVLQSKRKLGPEPEPGEIVGPGRAVFTYRVLASFERGLGERIRIETSGDGASCGLSGTVGRKYALGIDGKPGNWGAGLCSFMRPKALRSVADAAGSGARSSGDGCRGA